MLAYQQVLQSPELSKLFAELDAWPGSFQLERLSGHTHRLRKRIRQQVSKQIKQLATALGEPHFDRHALRILAKRTRFILDANPGQSSVTKRVIASLKTLRSALSTWHDLHQWCLRADAEPALKPLLLQWQQAEAEILRLRTLLDA